MQNLPTSSAGEKIAIEAFTLSDSRNWGNYL